MPTSDQLCSALIDQINLADRIPYQTPFQILSGSWNRRNAAYNGSTSSCLPGHTTSLSYFCVLRVPRLLPALVNLWFRFSLHLFSLSARFFSDGFSPPPPVLSSFLRNVFPHPWKNNKNVRDEAPKYFLQPRMKPPDWRVAPRVNKSKTLDLPLCYLTQVWSRRL